MAAQAMKGNRFVPVTGHAAIRCHLFPLTLKETRAYVEHRIEVASGKARNLITPAAHKRIYNYSGGIPRLINIVCDRAFLAAYVEQQKRITSGIVQKAVRELESKNISSKYFSPERQSPLTAILLLLCLLLIGYIIFYPDQPNWQHIPFFNPG